MVSEMHDTQVRANAEKCAMRQPGCSSTLLCGYAARGPGIEVRGMLVPANNHICSLICRIRRGIYSEIMVGESFLANQENQEEPSKKLSLRTSRNEASIPPSTGSI